MSLPGVHCCGLVSHDWQTLASTSSRRRALGPRAGGRVLGGGLRRCFDQSTPQIVKKCGGGGGVGGVRARADLALARGLRWTPEPLGALKNDSTKFHHFRVYPAIPLTSLTNATRRRLTCILYESVRL